MEGALPNGNIARSSGVCLIFSHSWGWKRSTPTLGDSGLMLLGWTQSRGSLWLWRCLGPRMGLLQQESCTHIHWGPGVVAKVIMGYSPIPQLQRACDISPSFSVTSSYCSSLLSGPITWDQLFGQETVTLFRKPADWEDCGLVSQRNILLKLEFSFIIKQGHVTGCWKLLTVGILALTAVKWV